MNRQVRDLIMGKVSKRLLDLLPPSEIMTHAACDESTADLFFSEDSGEQAQAREICMSCPVRQICLGYYSVIENQGIAGGLTAAERLKASVNKRVYSVDDVNKAIFIQKDLRALSAGKFAERHDVTERTYYRWKRHLDLRIVAS